MSKNQTTLKTGFPDLPIDPNRKGGVDNQDLLGLDSHAGALSSFIKMCSTPMTIGVQGDWGSGKTSLMNLVRAKLGDDRALNIWFNTWQYSQFGHDKQLASSMLINLMHKIKMQGNPSHKVWRNVSSFIRGVLQSTASSQGMDGRALLDSIEGKGDLDDAGLFEQMKDDFTKVIDDILGQATETTGFERVVIYIDDLDRLAPVKAVELLEAVKNLIDVAGCVFVLAIDYDVVIRGLRQKKGYHHEEGREDEGKSFFDKIIQVPYRMPVERYLTQDFLTKHYVRVYGTLSKRGSRFFDEHSADLIRLSVGNNPRGLKRALNIHSLFSHLINIGEEGEVGEEGRVLALVLAFIQVALPGMYSVLAKQTNPFRTLVALQQSSIYPLVLDTDESPQYDVVAEAIDRELATLRALTTEDDDDHEQDVAALRTLISDLRRVLFVDVTKLDVGKQRRMQGLATIALRATDLNGDGVYSNEELEVLERALSVAESTSVAIPVVEVAEEPFVVQARRHVGFKELSEYFDVLGRRPPLLFYDPNTEDIDHDIKRIPDYDSDISRFQFIVDGAAVRLKDETLRVLRQLSERFGREMTTREESERINPADYWVAEGDEEERTLTMLRDEWKATSSTEVDLRTASGRSAFHQRILAYLRSRAREYVPAKDVQEAAGGTATQVRSALNRLIEQDLVTWEGRARGTRYKIC
jgi:hypothetical protein